MSKIMDKTSYRFIVNCLGWSVVLLVVSSVIFASLKIDIGQLIPVLAPVLTLLGGLLVVPPKQ